MAQVARPRDLIIYALPSGEEPLTAWLDDLPPVMAGRIQRRIARMSLGNFGDHKGVGSGVQELRMTFGPGYRVYFAEDGPRLVLLLCGGDKGSQRQDIKRAVAYWQDYLDHREEEQP